MKQVSSSAGLEPGAGEPQGCAQAKCVLLEHPTPSPWEGHTQVVGKASSQG